MIDLEAIRKRSAKARDAYVFHNKDCPVWCCDAGDYAQILPVDIDALIAEVERLQREWDEGPELRKFRRDHAKTGVEEGRK